MLSILPVPCNHFMWKKDSYKKFPAKQQVEYKNEEAYAQILDQLGRMPPLVFPQEINQLKEQLRSAALGEKFILQGGDCAESFEDCQESVIVSKIKIMLQMSLVISYLARVPVVKIGRIAGQYAKPRSSPTEMHLGKEVLTYRGDNINSTDPTARDPDPNRLFQSHCFSSATLNFIRGILNSGFADLHDPHQWNFSHVVNEEIKREYTNIINDMMNALEFLKTVGADDYNPGSTFASKGPLSTVDFYTSHEGLHLNYEEQMTRSVGEDYFDLSAHILWIGDRTRQLDHAHVEFFRGIANPIGVKVGPSMKVQELINLLDLLNPDKEIGKIVLITRFGKDKVEEYLPNIIRAVANENRRPCWIVDPCHGNTIQSESGKKTRIYASIVEEIKKSFSIHHQNNSKLNGIHLEMTGESVTECVGGTMELVDKDLPSNYLSNCDPRLNYEQSLDIAFMLAKLLKTNKGSN
eukprot:NODE_43_length_33755_cov_1.178542.p6 type:complete len:465 gc:universal NODE_43_length_33755_cov_1.178542:15709-14315(-)